jgi:hypothetical protein
MWLWITSVLANLYEFTLKSSFVVSMTSFAAGESINYAISLISLFSYLSLDFEKAKKKDKSMPNCIFLNRFSLNENASNF